MFRHIFRHIGISRNHHNCTFLVVILSYFPDQFLNQISKLWSINLSTLNSKNLTLCNISNRLPWWLVLAKMPSFLLVCRPQTLSTLLDVRSSWINRTMFDVAGNWVALISSQYAMWLLLVRAFVSLFAFCYGSNQLEPKVNVHTHHFTWFTRWLCYRLCQQFS